MTQDNGSDPYAQIRKERVMVKAKELGMGFYQYIDYIKKATEDKKYITQRNSFISIAERLADKKCGTEPRMESEREDYVASWNFAFHSEMKRLTRNL